MKYDYWYAPETLDAYNKFERDITYRALMCTRKDWELTQFRRGRAEDNRKWAWIYIGKTRKMAWVDNKNMKAYKRDGYDKTWIEIKKYRFDRWCTTFDL